MLNYLHYFHISTQIPQSTEGKDWFYYVDKNVTTELLEQLTDEFIAIYEKSPARLKHKLSSTIKDLRSVRDFFLIQFEILQMV